MRTIPLTQLSTRAENRGGANLGHKIVTNNDEIYNIDQLYNIK